MNARRFRFLCGTALVLLAAASVPAGAQSGGNDDVVVIDGLMWSADGNGENVPWDAANAFCENLATAGFDDWRLPVLAELETLHDPSAPETGRLRNPFHLDDCCAWSSTSLADLPAEAKGVLPDPVNDPAGYYWGFLFPSGVRYYSFGRFPDGEALCVRDHQ